jgi:PAP2 superfamily
MIGDTGRGVLQEGCLGQHMANGAHRRRAPAARLRNRRVRGLVVATAVALAAPVATAVVPAEADEVDDQALAWNGHAYDELIRTKAQPPPVSMLHLAMVHGAMYDAVNAITGDYEPYLVSPPAEPSDSKDAAAATAAYRVLLHLLPDRAAQLGALYQASLDAIPNGSAEDGGIEVGDAAAAAMIAARTGDGRFGDPSFTVGTGTGEWRPVAAGLAGNNFAWVGRVAPFVMEDAAQFATPGPLDVGSAEYAAEFDQVKALGRATGSSRTADQTEQARFWADHTVAMWTRIFRQLSSSQHLSIDENARYFAMLYMTGSDAVIACFQDKERHDFWRPLTAIREAGTDGNPQTSPDPEWTPLIANPPYPDHPSGANCVTSAFVWTLRDFFGTNRMAFSATHATLGITRSFTHFSHALEEVRNARVYSGLHFMTAESHGVNLGREVAKWRDRHAFLPA